MLAPHLLSRPLALWSLFVSGILLVLCGCSSAAPTSVPGTPSPSAAASAKTLTIWHTFDQTHADAFQQLATEFQSIYPDYTIRTVYVGGHDDLTKQMTAAIALGSPPDLVLGDRRQIAEFATQGGLQPLDSLIDDPDLGLSKQDREDYWQGALNLGRYPTLGNHIYGFPFDQEPLVLFYNTELLKSVNINQPPQTWDQFAEDSAAVSQDQTYGWVMDADAATLEGILASRGSALLTNSETRALFQERAGLATLRMVADLNEGGVAELAASDEKAQTAFGSGQVAFYMGWFDSLNTLQQARKDAKKSFTIGVAPLPQLDPATPWLLTRGDLFAVARTSPERTRNAWFFIRWITSPTQSARWVRATDTLPLRASALTFLPGGASSKSYFQQILNALAGADPQLIPQPAHPFSATVEQNVGDLWLQATQPKPDLRVILDNMAARVNQLLAIQP